MHSVKKFGLGTGEYLAVPNLFLKKLSGSTAFTWKEDYNMRINGKEFCRDDIRQRVGDMAQIAGIKKMQFAEGKAKNLGCFEVNTGGGLEYTVLAERGLDIALARYKGTAFSYLSKTGLVHPSFYKEHEAEGFLQAFYAGLLTTCGYTYMGAPCIADGKCYGLHGRATGIPAVHLCSWEEWSNEEYMMSISGEMRESIVFGENIRMRRKITSIAGKNVIHIEDNVVNDGFEKTPLMMLYHINLGFPLLCEDTEVFIPAAKTEQYNVQAGKSDYMKIEKPQVGFEEKVFYHDLNTDSSGNTAVGLYNPSLRDAFGVYIRFNKNQLPVLTQWKQMGQQDYVLGLEPGTNKTLGYAHAREHEKLVMLEPGDNYGFNLEIGMIENLEEWTKFKSNVNEVYI